MSAAVTDALVAAYRDVGERHMRGLAVCNPRLSVEAVGFREWAGRCVGVLVAPWLMNLVVLPGPGEDWSDLTPGQSLDWDLPAGRYGFTLARVDRAPPHLTLSLFSTVVDFPDQATACAIAAEVMERVLASPPVAEDPPAGKRGVSRRMLLRRALGVGGREGPSA